jgi:hypothetical protein
MTFDEIDELWSTDCVIDKSDLSLESANIPILHNKYFKIYSKERYKLRSLETELKSLKLSKFEFYTMGPNEETPSDWKLPAQGRILKSEANQYVDTDPDAVKLNLRIYAQQEKVDYVESIIKMIMNRGFQIKSMIDWQKFISGAA